MCVRAFFSLVVWVQTATNAADAGVYRLHAYERQGRTIAACPPAATVFLYRNKMAANRRMLNEHVILDLLTNKYGIRQLRHLSIGGQNTSAEQACAPHTTRASPTPPSFAGLTGGARGAAGVGASG
jgi:hypothetical protein